MPTRLDLRSHDVNSGHAYAAFPPTPTTRPSSAQVPPETKPPTPTVRRYPDSTSSWPCKALHSQPAGRFKPGTLDIRAGVGRLWGHFTETTPSGDNQSVSAPHKASTTEATDPQGSQVHTLSRTHPGTRTPASTCTFAPQRPAGQAPSATFNEPNPSPADRPLAQFH